MILSHKLKLLFIAIPKTGTHAFRIALRKEMDSEDEEQVGLFVQKKFSNAEIAKINHGHISAEQLVKVIPPEIWKHYYKYAVVRNPWDKYISFCFFMNRENEDFQKDPTSFLNRIIDKQKVKSRILFRPQYEFVYDHNGEMLVNECGRFEDLQGSFDELAQRIGIQTQKLEHVNASVHDKYRKYYSEELKEKVADYYQRDIELFNFIY